LRPIEKIIALISKSKSTNPYNLIDKTWNLKTRLATTLVKAYLGEKLL